MASLERLKVHLKKYRSGDDFRMEGVGALSGSNVSDDGDKLDINSPLWNWSWALEGEKLLDWTLYVGSSLI